MSEGVLEVLETFNKRLKFEAAIQSFIKELKFNPNHVAHGEHGGEFTSGTSGHQDAKTIEDAKKFAKTELNVSYDDDGLSLDAMNTINRRLYELKKEYPSERLKRIASKEMSEYAKTSGVVMTFNKEYWNNKSKLLKSLNNNIKEKWSVNIPIEGIIDHEYAHVLTSSEILLNSHISKELNNVRNLYNEKMTELIKQGKDIKREDDFISLYANKSLDEFVAESFASARNKNNGKFIKDVFHIINKNFRK